MHPLLGRSVSCKYAQAQTYHLCVQGKLQQNLNSLKLTRGPQKVLFPESEGPDITRVLCFHCSSAEQKSFITP